ncbi:MAG: hypothetical protein QOJ41_303, partial [Acidobacteriaceae bacterium]|nr:hypothetical protein [Acidobacteriaceae bacterium]
RIVNLPGLVRPRTPVSFFSESHGAERRLRNSNLLFPLGGVVLPWASSLPRFNVDQVNLDNLFCAEVEHFLLSQVPVITGRSGFP